MKLFHILLLIALALQNLATQSIKDQKCLKECSLKENQIEKIQSYTEHELFIKQIAYSKCGQYIISASGDQKMKIYDTKTKQIVKVIEHPQYVLSLDVSHNNTFIASGGWDKIVRIFKFNGSIDEIEQKPVLELEGPIEWISSVQFSPDNKYITASSGTQVFIWNFETGQQHAVFNIKEGIVFNVVFSKSGKYLASGSTEHNIIIYDVEEKKEVSVLQKRHTSCVTSVQFLGENEQYVISTSWDEHMVLSQWKNEEKIINTWKAHDSSISSVDISSDQKYALTASEDHSVRIWNVQDLFENQAKNITFLEEILNAHSSEVWHAKFNPLHQSGILQFASSGEDFSVNVWDFSQLQNCQNICQKNNKEDL